MPFKDPQRAIEYRRSDAVKKRSREFMAKWREANRDENRKRQREYMRTKRKDFPSYEAWKKDPAQIRKRNKYSRKYWRRNKEVLNEKQNQKTRSLADYYIRKQLSKEGASMNQLDENPVIIEAKRLTLKIKREIYGKLN